LTRSQRKLNLFLYNYVLSHYTLPFTVLDHKKVISCSPSLHFIWSISSKNSNIV